MMREFKIMRRNPAKNANADEVENVPPNHEGSLNPQTTTEPSRAPFTAIAEPPPIPKSISDRTPVKPKRKYSDASMHLRTPEKQGKMSRNRLNLDHKSENPSNNGVVDPKDEGRAASDVNVNTPSSARVAGRATSSFPECNSAQSTPCKSVSARMAKGIPRSCNTLNVVNTVEVPYFELKEEPSFWMEHNVQVLIRIRPLNNMEKSSFGFSGCLKQESAQSISWIGQPETRFMFDHVACEGIDQEMLFKMVGLPMVENCLSGYNSCMFAYGQTGSGKTYTMLGDIDDLEINPSPNRGMTPRVFELLFSRIRAEEESRRDEQLKYNCKCSFLEIYNEQITDLLDPSSTNLMLREDMKKGVYVENLSEFEVTTVGDILQLLTEGSSNRRVAATNMNRESSRSHSVFTCVIESRWEKDSTTNFRFARLNLVDLAGSERQKSSGAEGERLKEAANINKSLSTLGHVIMVLVDDSHGKPRHVPYRDSRLTFLLQDSLGGNSKTMIIANVSPSICSGPETLNTLKFAQRAKLIQNSAVINEDSSGDVVVLKHQIQLLKEELSALKRERVNRSLMFSPATDVDTRDKGDDDTSGGVIAMAHAGNMFGKESEGVLRVSHKQSAEDIMNLQLELDILKMILEEERSYHSEREEMVESLNQELEMSKEKVSSVTIEYEKVQEELKTVKLVLEALESEQIQSINEIEDLRSTNARFAKMLEEKELEISYFKDRASCQELKNLSLYKPLEDEGSPLTAKLQKMHESLDKAKRLNELYQNDLAFEESHQEEMEEVRRQVEGETAEVIVCLQEELSGLQQEVHESRLKELETSDRLAQLQTEMKITEENLRLRGEENAEFAEILEDKEKQLKMLTGEWDLIASEIEGILSDGNAALKDASDQTDIISNSFCHKRSWISEQFGRIKQCISEKEFLIDELNQCLKDAIDRKDDVERMLSSLRGAALVMTENHQQECSKKDREILFLTSDLNDKTSTVSELHSLIKHGEDQLRAAASCATAVLVLVNRLWELNSNYHSALQDKELQIRELNGIISKKDIDLQNQVHSFQKKLEASEEYCAKLSLELSEERRCREAQESNITKSEENRISETRVQLQDIFSGISSLKLRTNKYEMESGYPQKDNASEMSICFSTNDECESRTDTRTVQDINDIGPCSNVCMSTQLLKCFTNAAISKGCNGDDNNLESEFTLQSTVGRESDIILLKKEIECALKSLQELQVQMDKMHSEKEELLGSEKCSRKNIESMISQTDVLRDAIDNLEGVFALQVNAIDGKIRRMEEAVQESLASWLQQRELLEDELDEAKIIAAQKSIEASCILKKFEEVQDTVKEADIMINELMIANEALKLSARDAKVTENNLLKEVQSLKLSNNLKDQNYEELERKYDTDLVIMKRMISELEDAVSEVQTTSTEEWMSVASDFLSVKRQTHESTESIRKLFEEVWSEIIGKDCAVSVLHLCHMGILLETANGLNAENGLLHHGLCESNYVISELQDHNLKSRRELEMCRVLKGKLLEDIKKGFDRISNKVDETGEVTLKLSSFKKKIQDLQHQEEVMLQRSNDIGSELAMLMKELDLSNKQALASIMDQERLMKEKDELFHCQEENFMLELLAKDLESLTMSAELMQIRLLKEDTENAYANTLEVLENLKQEIVFKSFDACLSELMLYDKESRHDKLVEDFKMKETAMEISSSYISELHQQIMNLQNAIRLLETESCSLPIELERKDEKLERIRCLEKENESLLLHLSNCKAEYQVLHQELEDKNIKFEASARNTHIIDVENHRLRDTVSELENCIAKLEEDLTLARVEIRNHELSQSDVQADLCSRIQDLEMQLGDIPALKEENICLRNELSFKEINETEYVNALNLRSLKNIDMADAVDKAHCNIFRVIEEKFIEVDGMFQKIDNEMEHGHKFLDQVQFIENFAMQLDSEILYLHTELSRKDEILEGLLFDLSLLQESSSSSKDQKDEKDELLASLKHLEMNFDLRSLELEAAAAECQILEAKLQEKTAKISSLESDLTNENQRINYLSQENAELLAVSQDALLARKSMEKELIETRNKIESLELEVAEMERALAQLNKTTESLKINLDNVTCQSNELEGEVLTLTKELKIAQALVKENEGIAIEAQEKAELQKVNAEEKEVEVKLLERSIDELEHTINVLEQKVDIVKGEAERQRLQREELELQLLSVKEQMHEVNSNDSDVKRCLEEKEKILLETLQRVQLLETEIAARDAEMSQCKAHISELNLHAEAQASECKQKFKALEAMKEQVKSEVSIPGSSNPSSNKMERNPSKPRGSGSPFKCIGLGLVQQIKSEKYEELTAGRDRIEELEALAASRQKEVFMLKARLAATESMTHDVIRDLLGVKLNMKNYANLMDNQQLHSFIEKAQRQYVESEVKEQELATLKQQLNEFLKERNGWLEETERKQAELMAALVALEKLRQQDQLLATENEMLKTENVNHKKRVMEVEFEAKKLSGQQNIQQRIHHHAKIKEENNSLRSQNEELNIKLHEKEAVLARVKEEISHFQAANGGCPYINFDDEQL